MKLVFYRSLLFIIFINVITLTHVFAQTITIGSIDPGPYGQGSSIAVPIQINGVINKTNSFNLYLSDASGNFGARILIGSFSGFYTPFINGTIPAATPLGNGYRIEVESSAPLVTSAPSASFSVNAGPPPVASISGPVISPGVFGYCNNAGKNNNFTFTNTSTPGSVATIDFYDEATHTKVNTVNNVASGAKINFAATPTHYTIIVTAKNGGLTNTTSYLLLNNKINNSFGVSGGNTVCLGGGGGTLTYTVDYTGANGIQYNYPGTTYQIGWGDSKSDTYSLEDLKALGGTVSHTYTTTSCGNVIGGHNNVYEVNITPISPYCGVGGATSITSYATVLQSPKNTFTGPVNDKACTNTAVTFTNTSLTGEIASNTPGNCINTGALYNWSVDGTIVANDVPISQAFTYTFTTKGPHTVQLDLENGTSSCPAASFIKTICVEDPPVPKFTLPASICLTTTTTATVTDQSTIDNGCSPNVYTWNVTGPAAVGYGGGTNANSKTPQFVFSKPGTYQVTLTIDNQICTAVTSPAVSIVVNDTPVATLSLPLTLCSNNQTFTFDPAATNTKTTFAGTGDNSATYLWTVTPSGGAVTAATFVNGTSPASQYPQITFPDYGTYTVTVKYTNSCGTDTKTQAITMNKAPTVTVTAAQPNICPGSTVAITGTITGPNISYSWIGNGTFSSGTLNTVYTPTAAEIAAGKATITLDVKSGLAAPCDDIPQPIVVNIYPINTINSPSSITGCTSQALNYAISSTVPGSTFNWTSALTSGTATGFTTGNGNAITDVINNSSATADAIITYTITPSKNGCAGTPFTLKVTIHPLPVITATAAGAQICSNQSSNITLGSNIPGTAFTWTSTANSGITGNSNQGAAIVTGVINDMLINNGPSAGTVTYTITPVNSGTCNGTSTTVSITVQPNGVVADAGPDDEICGTVGTYTLKGNNPPVGTGKWTVASGQPGITFSDDTKPNAVVSGLVPGQNYQFTWAITFSALCPPSSKTVSIIVDKQSVAGSTAGQATVCSGSNNGQITLTGQVGNIVRWESSIDGTTWQPIVNATAAQPYTNLTQTTQYRAIVQSGVCASVISTVTTITVNAPTVVAAAGPDQNLCNVASITLNGNDPTPFAGAWTQTSGPSAVIVDPTNNQTQVTGLLAGNTYKFAWTIKGLPPCADSQSVVTIFDAADVTASFTPDKAKGCADPVGNFLLVNFTNTSTPGGGNFLWDFGDGTTSNLPNPQHAFIARTDGKDTVYSVSLSVVNNCVVRPPVTQTITVKSLVPEVRILPNKLKACGAFSLVVRNTTTGAAPFYDFYLLDDQAKLVQKIEKTDKSSAQFDPITTTSVKTFTLYMIGTGECGSTESIHIPITISPSTFTSQMFVQNNAQQGCAPFQATFVNICSGGNSFQYNIYDSPTSVTPIQTLTAGRANYNYTFTKGGVYYVTITANTDCGIIESSPRNRMDIYPLPLPDFIADVTNGCRSQNVNFTNITPDDPGTPASSLNYEWDFGDGSPHEFTPIPATHTYSFKNSPYTVTLTATNKATNCSNVMVKKNYINILTPPTPAFTVKPDTIIKIPYYHFSFVNQSSPNAKSWNWTFGDGASSTQKNPEHTYADTGLYKVTMIASNNSCDSAIVHYVRIIGIPGQLYLPNAFIPGSLTPQLQTFMAKGSGLKDWHMQIFNNWGQLIWETSKLNNKGAPIEGWDGTINGVQAQQGAYVWVVSANFVNGTKWKGMSYNNSLPSTTGVIHLIR